MVDTEHCIIMVILGVFSIVGTIGNFLVLYIYTKKRDRTTSNIFILTLAGTDFLTCLVLIPFNIVAIGLDHRLEIDFFCKLYMFFLTCNVPFSAFVMVAIAFDRYFCICHPFLHAINIPRAKAIVFLMAGLACVFGILTSMMYSVFRSPMPENTKGTNVTCLNTAPSSDQPYNTSYTAADLCGEVGITSNDTDAEGEDLEGVCGPFSDIFGENFIWVYQKIYASFYLLSFLIVFVLYGLIYRAIHLRRALKAKRKRSSLFPAAAEISMAETQMTALNGNNIDHTDSSEKCLKKKHTGQMKDKNFYANIRTAAMLFIVTVVFLLAFLPAWLMAHGWIPYSPIVFYMYFLYNVANPVIYAFMNMSFRADLRSLLCAKR